jgi:hypothetical protein
MGQRATSAGTAQWSAAGCRPAALDRGAIFGLSVEAEQHALRPHRGSRLEGDFGCQVSFDLNRHSPRAGVQQRSSESHSARRMADVASEIVDKDG